MKERVNKSETNDLIAITTYLHLLSCIPLFFLKTDFDSIMS